MTAAVLAGLGAWLPPRIVTNDEVAEQLSVTADWILARTGIGSRRWADDKVSTVDLAVEAGSRALEAAGVTRADAVVVATTTPERLCPAAAPEVASRLGMTGGPAFDVAAACTGFLYAVASALSLITAAGPRSVLVIGAELFSSFTDPLDRATAMVFADGAGAALLRAGDPDEPGAFGRIVLGSDGSLSDVIEIPAGARQRSTRRPAEEQDYCVRIEGREVFRNAVEHMGAASQEALAARGWTVADVDRIIPHQANARISATLANRLGVDSSRVMSNIERVGNTSAASIPLLLTESVIKGDVQAGQRVLLTAFGGGVTWGATTLEWPDVRAIADHIEPALDEIVA